MKKVIMEPLILFTFEMSTVVAAEEKRAKRQAAPTKKRSLSSFLKSQERKLSLNSICFNLLTHILPATGQIVYDP